MPVVKTSAKGQLVIPVELRVKYGLKAGSLVYLNDTGKEIILSPVPARPIETACGILKGGKSLVKALRVERRKELRHEKKKHP